MKITSSVELAINVNSAEAALLLRGLDAALEAAQNIDVSSEDSISFHRLRSALAIALTGTNVTTSLADVPAMVKAARGD